LSLATFDSRDPWLNHVVSGAPHVYNKAGLLGAYLSGSLYEFLGFASWIIPVFLCLAGARRILGAQEWAWWRWTGFVLLGLCICLAGAANDSGDVKVFAKGVLSQSGGFIGHVLYAGMVGWLSFAGTFLIWLFSLLLAMQMLTRVSWLSLLAMGSRALWRFFVAKTCRLLEQRAKRKQTRLTQAEEAGRQACPVQPPLEITAFSISPAADRYDAADPMPSAPKSLKHANTDGAVSPRTRKGGIRVFRIRHRIRLL